MVTFQEHVPLADHVHYRLGGPARYFCAVTSIHELKDALARAEELRQKIFILGSGTNLLISDNGFDGAVIKPEIKFLRVDDTVIEAGAGALMSDLLEFAGAHSLSGLEWAGGLPGTVGGAVRGNAGAFGGEIKDSAQRATTVNAHTLDVRIWTNEACRFGYRTSAFKEQGGEEVIVSATFALAPGDPAAIRAAIKEKIGYRAARHPLEYPNIGSIFKNVPVSEVPTGVLGQMRHVVKDDPFPVVPVAYLISECGLRGAREGGAEISAKHPNFIVNVCSATAGDVEALIARAKDAVGKKFHIAIEEEITKV